MKESDGRRDGFICALSTTKGFNLKTTSLNIAK